MPPVSVFVNAKNESRRVSTDGVEWGAYFDKVDGFQGPAVGLDRDAEQADADGDQQRDARI